MPDTKLTDLEIVTQPKNGDILYIVDINNDASKQITYNNLVGTKITSLSTSFDNLSGGLVVDIEANTTNITTAQNDIVTNTTNINTLSTEFRNTSANIASISAFIFPGQNQISGVNMSSFSFGTAMTVSSASIITQHVTTQNTEIGDIGIVSLSALGGLSGLQTNFYPISTNTFELNILPRINDDRSITIPANTVFSYYVTRNVIQ
tara:strand:+ start:9669 stop:10286 length:618 start_codon:yes stop_codon:yes gene_type:complete